MYPRIRTPTLAQQGFKLKALQPRSKLNIDHGGNRLQWYGYLRPTPLSDKYQIRITVEKPKGMVPAVEVISPKLRSLNDEIIPHMYDQDSFELCLWHPQKGEWKSSMWIADSVLPWTAEWLFFYEVWLCTGDWMGGGEHPEN